MSGKKESTNMTDLFTIDLDNFDEGKLPGVTMLLNPQKMAEAAAKKAANEKKSMASIPQPEPVSAAEIKLEALETTKENTFDLGNSAPKIETFTPSPSATAPSHSAASGNGKTLTSMGVGFELNFKKERDFFRFESAKGHQKGALPGWQHDLFKKMKLNPSLFAASQTFQEFDAQSNVFALDAFGASPAAFIQMVQNSPQEWTVLISINSLKKEKDTVIQILKSGPASNSGSSGGSGGGSGGGSPAPKAPMVEEEVGTIELDFAS